MPVPSICPPESPGWASAGAHGVWRWPLPAVLTWLAAWTLTLLLPAAGIGSLPAQWCGVALSFAVACKLPHARPWRRWLTALGYPLALLVSGALVAWPAWCWLLPLALLLLAYPLHAWRDAPLFPTPPLALQGLAAMAVLPLGARILDAGCGLGHGLNALRREWPQARIEGVESSWPLRLACGLRCRFAEVRQGDMWRADWSGCAMVYLFQRPESMARAWAKAQSEMSGGGWLLSLAFEVPGAVAHAVQTRPGCHSVWLYRVGTASSASTQPAHGR